MAPIIITPGNSPYNVPGGSVNYDQVEIQGGWMQLLQQTVLNITSLKISAALKSKKMNPLVLTKAEVHGEHKKR